jgi:hypothetical protein
VITEAMRSCVDWLKNVAGWTAWYDEMHAFRKEVLDSATSEIQRELYLNN